MKRFHLSLIAAACASLAAIPAARAQYLGLEADFGVPGEELLDLGWGVQGRIGTPVPVQGLRLDTEIAFDYSHFGGSDIISGSSIWRIVGGLRLGVEAPVIPYAFAHIGYGRASSDLAEGSESEGGLAWDVGLASDLVSAPPVTLGVHAAYKVWDTFVDDQSELELDPVRWVGIGIHGHFGFAGEPRPRYVDDDGGDGGDVYFYNQNQDIDQQTVPPTPPPAQPNRNTPQYEPGPYQRPERWHEQTSELRQAQAEEAAAL
jgi:hypothetical protein